MKILCVIDSLGPGGAQRQLTSLAIGFKERGHEVSFLVYHKISFYEKLLGGKIPVTIIIEQNPLKRLWRMRQFIRRGGFNVVLSFLSVPNFTCELSGFPYRKWKLIIGERSANPNIRKSIKSRIFKLLHVFSDYVVANSYKGIELAKKINPLLKESKCRVIYNIVDLEKCQPSLDYLQLKDGKFNLVIAASHRSLKNLDGLIEAVNLLGKEDRTRIEIKWYGQKDDDSLDLGRIKIREYGLTEIFNFYEATNEIYDIMQHADAIGLFSFHEGFPNAICEGMAFAKPIVSTKVSDISVILKDKRFLCDATNPESIKEVIIRLINLSIQDRKELGEENRIIAERLFDKELIINQYLSLMTSSEKKFN